MDTKKYVYIEEDQKLKLVAVDILTIRDDYNTLLYMQVPHTHRMIRFRHNNCLLCRITCITVKLRTWHKEFSSRAYREHSPKYKLITNTGLDDTSYRKFS